MKKKEKNKENCCLCVVRMGRICAMTFALQLNLAIGEYARNVSNRMLQHIFILTNFTAVDDETVDIFLLFSFSFSLSLFDYLSFDLNVVLF